MQRASQSGFILPQALLIAASILVLAVLQLRQETRFAEIQQVRSLNVRAKLTLRLNAQSLVHDLERSILRADVASALRPSENSPNGTFEPVRIQAGEPRPVRPLHSAGVPHEPVALFLSGTTPPRRLEAEWINLSDPASPVDLSLAWAAEDGSLAPANTPTPAFWPLPAWDFAPLAGQLLLVDHLNRETNGNWIAGPWMPASDPIPFIPEASPACVPIIRRIDLKIGLFASGPVRNREKTVRLRFYIEGELWNPYNRPMELHTGSTKRAVFQVLFFNLPEVRIRNQSLGFSSGWMSIDEAPNSASGKYGLSAWVELPHSLAPGQYLPFFEPDPAHQPEGLARTLHPGFPVGPADQIQVDFRPHPDGAAIAYMSINGDTSVEAARGGAGWFRLEAIREDWPALTFPRADSLPRPFLVEGGSLAFRIANAHLQIGAQLDPRSLTRLDPRRSQVRMDLPYTQADGTPLNGQDWFHPHIKSLISDTGEGSTPPPAVADRALFSWPHGAPGNLLEATDLPQWENGYLLGSPGSSQVNALMDTAWIREPDPLAGELTGLKPAGAEPQSYRKTFHINKLDPESWIRKIQLAARPGGEPNMATYEAFATPNPAWAGDRIDLSRETLEGAAAQIVADIQENPYASVSGLLNRGKLVELIQPERAESVYTSLLPLRSWLGEAPALVSRGSAWIVHLAVRARQENVTIVKTARIWLLETVSASGLAEFAIIRFEWTDPEVALAGSQANVSSIWLPSSGSGNRTPAPMRRTAWGLREKACSINSWKASSSSDEPARSRVVCWKLENLSLTKILLKGRGALCRARSARSSLKSEGSC